MFTEPFILTVPLTDGEASPVIGGGGQQTQSAPATETQTSTAAPERMPEEEAPTGSIVLPTIIMYGVLFFAFYMLLFRPQRKKSKEMKQLHENIRPGDNIVTQGGLFGKVTDVGEDSYVIEFGTNRGIKVPVLKSEVAAIRSPKLTPPPAPALEEKK